MILTHSNHVRLIVGFIDTPGNPQLIYVDPIWSEVDGIEFFRKGDLRAKAYEVIVPPRRRVYARRSHRNPHDGNFFVFWQQLTPAGGELAGTTGQKQKN